MQRPARCTLHAIGKVRRGAPFAFSDEERRKGKRCVRATICTQRENIRPSMARPFSFSMSLIAWQRSLSKPSLSACVALRRRTMTSTASADDDMFDCEYSRGKRTLPSSGCPQRLGGNELVRAR